MFNLEQAILEWRRQMLAADIKSPVPLDELESHLCDEIEHQTKLGLSEENAFKAAVKNLGPAPVLQPEFKKVETKTVVGWSLKRAISLDQIALTTIPYLLSLVSLYIGSQVFFIGLPFSQRMSCLAAIATMLLFVWGGRLGYGLFPVLRSKKIRNVIQYSSFAMLALWLVAFFNIILPWYQTNGSPFLVVFMWGFITPFGPWAGLLLGIETAARKNAALAGS